jgi:hypothetical protein
MGESLPSQEPKRFAILCSYAFLKRLSSRLSCCLLALGLSDRRFVAALTFRSILLFAVLNISLEWLQCVEVISNGESGGRIAENILAPIVVIPHDAAMSRNLCLEALQDCRRG